MLRPGYCWNTLGTQSIFNLDGQMAISLDADRSQRLRQQRSDAHRDRACHSLLDPSIPRVETNLKKYEETGDANLSSVSRSKLHHTIRYFRQDLQRQLHFKIWAAALEERKTEVLYEQSTEQQEKNETRLLVTPISDEVKKYLGAC